MRFNVVPIALAALLAASAVPGEARANPRAPEVVKALEALRDGRFEDAIKACTPGAAGEAQPSCSFIRAHALHALGKHLEAYEALRIFGARGGDEAKNAPVAREALKNVLLTHLVRVSVACSVEGPADVIVNGKIAKACPTTGPIVTEPGEIVIEVRKAGFKTAQTKIQVSAGGAATARVDLVPSSGSSPEAQTASKQQEPKKPDTATEATTDTGSEEATDTDSDDTEPATEPSPKTRTASRGSPTGASPKPSQSSPWEVPPRDPPPQSSKSSCGPGCVFLIVIGGAAVVGLGAAIVVGATAEKIPAPIGDLPPGQVRVPLAIW